MRFNIHATSTTAANTSSKLKMTCIMLPDDIVAGDGGV